MFKSKKVDGDFVEETVREFTVDERQAKVLVQLKVGESYSFDSKTATIVQIDKSWDVDYFIIKMVIRDQDGIYYMRNFRMNPDHTIHEERYLRSINGWTFYFTEVVSVENTSREWVYAHQLDWSTED